MKKRSLSWKHAAGLSLHLLMDNFFRAVITVVLLGVCCAAFGVCICAYGHDYMGTQAEIFRAYEANTVALSRFCFFRGLNVSATDCMGLQTQDVAQLEETFGGRAALSLAGNVLVNVIFRTVLRVPIAVAGFDLVAFLSVIALGLAVGALAESCLRCGLQGVRPFKCSRKSGREGARLFRRRGRKEDKRRGASENRGAPPRH